MEVISLNSSQNHIDDEKCNIQLRKKYFEENFKPKEEPLEIIQKSNSIEEEKIPEIRDIYDHIYGNVKSKKVFYESKQDQDDSNGLKKKVETSTSDVKSLHVRDNFAEDEKEEDEKGKGDSSAEDLKEGVGVEKKEKDEEDGLQLHLGLSNGDTTSDLKDVYKTESVTKRVHFAEPLITSTEQEPQLQKSVTDLSLRNLKLEVDLSESSDSEITSPNVTPTNSSLLKEQPVVEPCLKCDKIEYENDRSEILTEINANIKLELESVKKQLKEKILKNNELNFEIANIESSLEAYYREAKSQQSTFNSLYSAMKNYVADTRGDFYESYTYKRVRMIADYMESLKNKLEHQDRIIKGNFIDNPYYTDLIIKHDAVLKQLDKLSQTNQELGEELKTKKEEDIDTIKELNRQVFQLEGRCKDIEGYYKNELNTKEVLLRKLEDDYQRQLAECKSLLEAKEEETAKIKRNADARINIYKQELVIVYRKWKDLKSTKKESNSKLEALQ